MPAPGAPEPAAPPAGPGELRCRHFGRCSGCALEHELQRPAQYLEARDFFAQNGFPGLQLVSGPVHGWRCRAKLAVRGSCVEPRVGLFRQGSHEVVDIVPGCEIHHPRINEAAALIKNLVKKLKVPPYNESTKAGLLRYLQLTVVGDQAAGHPSAERDPDASVQVVLVLNAASTALPAFAAARALAAALWRDGRLSGRPALIHSVWAHLNQPSSSSSSNVIIGRGEWSLMHGEGETWQTFGGSPVCLGPGSFVQANYGAFQSALSSIRTFVQPGSRVLELHAGVGAIGLSLFSPEPLGPGTDGRQGQHAGPASLRCVEINPSAAAPFERSRERLLHELALRCQLQAGGDAGAGGGAGRASSAPSIDYVVAAAGDGAGELLAGADVVIVDPPRKGLEAALLQALCQDGGAAVPHTLVYLSCGWDALKQEFGPITQRYRLVHACTYLFFPGTNAIETLCVFQRKDHATA